MVSKSVSNCCVSERPPHLKRDKRNGTWLYRRVIPPRLRSAFGGKSEIIRSLGTSTERFTDREFKRAYALVKADVEEQLRLSENPAVSLTERDEFGLMKELLLAYEMQGAPGSPLERQMAEALVVRPSETTIERSERLLVADKQVTYLLLGQVLGRLGIQLNLQQIERVVHSFDEHKVSLLSKRREELLNLNFNSVGGVLEQLPEAPSHITSWEQLREAWIEKRGGRRTDAGLGLSPGSINRAEQHWTELQTLNRIVNPSDLTTEMVRKWIQWMRGQVVPTTVLSNLKLIKAILKTGVAEGLLKENVAETLTVTAEEVEGYLPFTEEEIHRILKATENHLVDYQKWLPRLALYSGARIEELAQLRKKDVRTINGVLCLDIVHRPQDKLPTFLKG